MCRPVAGECLRDMSSLVSLLGSLVLESLPLLTVLPLAALIFVQVKTKAATLATRTPSRRHWVLMQARWTSTLVHLAGAPGFSISPGFDTHLSRNALKPSGSSGPSSARVPLRTVTDGQNYQTV